MTIEEALYSHLSTDISLPALVGTRIYPDNLKQFGTEPSNPSEFPAITYSKVSGIHLHSHDGSSGMVSRRFQIECWAITKSQALAVAEAVRIALDGYTGTMGGGVPVSSSLLIAETPSFYHPASKLYREGADYMIQHEVPQP